MIAFVLTAICTGICWKIWQQSKNNIDKGVVDNGSQFVVTVGVIFTFFGIALGLWNFDTESANMKSSIDIFIAGMKTAFWTSIIGMGFGIFIKWKQSAIEQSDDTLVKKKLDAISQSLVGIKTSIDANSNVVLQHELSKLVTAMSTFVESSNDSRADMKELSESMKQQGVMLEQLSKTLTQNIQALSAEITESGKKKSESIETAIKSFGEQQKNSLATLSGSIIKAGEEQSARLDTMNQTIEKMRTVTEATQENSAELLSETRDYQQQSLANDNNQAKILTDNTTRIVEMKNAFDTFLNKMAENYSNELIRALNESMAKLNTQLQSQFGDNFKELNAAVREIAVWQREYKSIVEKTTEELKSLNKIFADFVEKVAVDVDTHIQSMTQNLQTFTDTSSKNVAVQENLNVATSNLAETIAQARQSVSAMQAVISSFGKLIADVTSQNDSALKAYSKMIEDNIAAVGKLNEKLGSEIKKLDGIALTATTNAEHYLRDFNTVSDDVMSEIRKTLERFKTDFDTETKTSLANLNKIFEKIAKNTDAQSDKAIKTLAGSLSTITVQLIENYNALIERIAELDRIIGERSDRN